MQVTVGVPPHLLLCVSPECCRKVWDAVSGAEVLTLAHKHIVKSVHFTKVGPDRPMPAALSSQ